MGKLIRHGILNTSLSSNNQAYATIAENNEITDSIRKACPTYQGNNNDDIKSLVYGNLKVCLGDNNQPPTTPNPDTTHFPNSIMNFEASIRTDDIEAAIIITDAESHDSNSYSISIGEIPSVADQFTIPIGDQYTYTVITDGGPPVPVTFFSTSCQHQDNTCTGTMNTSP